MMSLIILSHLGVMEHSPSSPQLSSKEEPTTQEYVAKENFERHLAAVASAAAAAAAVAAASASSTNSGQAKSNSSFLIEDILHQKQKSSIEENKEDKSIERKPATAENTHNFGNSELALSRLHDYGNLAAYFTSHAAAAMASSTTSPMNGFLQQHGAYLSKTHAPIPSPFFLPTGKIFPTIKRQ